MLNVGFPVGDIGVGLSLLVASFAGCGNVVLTCPIWVVATRMQAQQAKGKDDSNSSPLSVAQEVYDESGLKVSRQNNLGDSSHQFLTK